MGMLTRGPNRRLQDQYSSMLQAGLGRRPLDGEGGTETEDMDEGRTNGTWKRRNQK